MITLISFIALLVAGANWLSIGMLQYDFIAGIFGTQSSFLSRTVYIFFGVCAAWMLIMAIKQKGKIKINDNGFGKQKDLLASSNHQSEHEKPYQSHHQATNAEFANEIHTSRSYNMPHNMPNNMSSDTSTNVELGQEIHRANAHFLKNPFEKDN